MSHVGGSIVAFDNRPSRSASGVQQVANVAGKAPDRRCEFAGCAAAAAHPVLLIPALVHTGVIMQIAPCGTAIAREPGIARDTMCRYTYAEEPPTGCARRSRP